MFMGKLLIAKRVMYTHCISVVMMGPTDMLSLGAERSEYIQAPLNIRNGAGEFVFWVRASFM